MHSDVSTAIPSTDPAGFDPGPPILRLRLIGPMAAWTLKPQNMLPSGRKTRALLAILAMNIPHGESRARLAEMLWSGRPERQSRASLRQELHRLQEALAASGVELLQTSRDQVALKPKLVWVDVAEIYDASREHPSALALVDRDLLEGMEGIDPVFDLWILEQRKRLRVCSRDLAEGVLVDIVDPEMAMMAAQRLLSIDAAHEGAWRAMIRGFAVRGEYGKAIQTFERCKVALAEHLGAQPSRETVHLVVQIRGERDLNRHNANDKTARPHRQATVPLSSPIASLPNTLRVGVLPLSEADGGVGMRPVAVGLADGITAALTRNRWFTTVSSRAVQHLGLDYLLAGTLQQAGSQLRLTMRLIDLSAEQNVIWADHFDADMTDLFATQDRLIAQVSARVDVALLDAEAVKPISDPPRATQHLRAVPLMMRFDRHDFDMAGTILRDATMHSPERADVFGWYGFWHILALIQGWDPDPATLPARALALVERGHALDRLSPLAVLFHGMVRHLLFCQPREGLVLYERARLLNPYFPAAWALIGMAHMHLGNFDQAEQNLIECARLAPLPPLGFLFESAWMSLALLRQDFVAAAQLGRKLTELYPRFVTPYGYYLAVLGHLGQTDTAAILLQRAIDLYPGFCQNHLLMRFAVLRQTDRDLILAGLKLAGVPVESE